MAYKPNPQRSISRIYQALRVSVLLLASVAMTGCGQQEIDSEVPLPPDGVAMLRNFLTQVADPDKPMPQMFGIEPAFADAMRHAPDQVAPLKPLCNRLKSAGSDKQRRKIASEMLEKLPPA
ncbi:hypothetical protein DTL42_16210 [Bremerella cremea]|uniref:HEAT repeat domain-containing protein n=1 Tax=Bremerella cremea TaxID=1031537 RepID=A0A368KQU9_9BACT|nr:hypothetical protein [Bremerella cremea]RCS46031.1 hypothetical protein DTL42_16210 [Bremerella cremea]